MATNLPTVSDLITSARKLDSEAGYESGELTIAIETLVDAVVDLYQVPVCDIYEDCFKATPTEQIDILESIHQQAT